MDRWRLSSPNWQWKEISEYIELKYGKGLSQGERQGGDVKVFGANGEIGQHDTPLTNGTTIIIGRKGSVGAVNLCETACWPIDTTYYIDEYPQSLKRKYLYYYLKFRKLGGLDRSAAIPGLNRDDFYKIGIPLPFPEPNQIEQSLAEQDRIVARIEALFAELAEMRALHEKIVGDTGLLMDAVLFHTFQVLEKKGTATRSIEELTDVSSGGTPSRSNPEYYKGDIPWIKTGELKDNVLYDAEEHITHQAIVDSNAKKFPVGTLLIAMYGQGQTRGRTGVLGIEAATNQACCAIYPNSNEFDTFYLQFWFRYMYTQLRRQSEARGGSQPNLNQTIIKALKPPLPDIDVQKKHVAFFNQVEQETTKALDITKRDATNLEQLEQAVLAQAFRGEL